VRFDLPALSFEGEAYPTLAPSLAVLGATALFSWPLVRLKDSELPGFEALTPWPRPVKDMITPGLAPFAEERGQIVPPGRWTLLLAAAHLVR